MSQEKAVVICATSNYDHVKNVKEVECSVCGNKVWLAKTTEDQVKAEGFDGITPICLNCMPNYFKGKEVKYEMPSDDMLEEIAKEKNIPKNNLKSKIKQSLNLLNQNYKYN